MELKDLVILAASCIFLPLLPLFDVFFQYSSGKTATITLKEHGVPAILSLIILGVAIGVSFVDIYEESVVDTVAFLNRVLSFLLPLNLTACIAKNKLGLSKFRSMCMEFQEVAWQVHGLIKEDKEKKYEDKKFKDIMSILQKLPAIIKHDIRKDGKKDSIGDDTAAQQIKDFIPESINKFSQNDPNKKYENISYILLERLHEDIAGLSKEKSKENGTIGAVSVNIPSVNNLFRGMNKAVTFLSEIESIQAYLLPDLFFGFFYIVILVYFTLLPVSIDESGIDCAWKCYVQLYVFMGMFFVGLYIQNAFRSSKTAGIQTVSKIHQEHERKFTLLEKQQLKQGFAIYSDNLFTKRYY